MSVYIHSHTHIYNLKSRGRELNTNLVLFENSPFFAVVQLASFAVLPPVYGVAHGRHFLSFLSMFNFFFVSSKRKEERKQRGVAVQMLCSCQSRNKIYCRRRKRLDMEWRGR